MSEIPLNFLSPEQQLVYWREQDLKYLEKRCKELGIDGNIDLAHLLELLALRLERVESRLDKLEGT